MNNKTTTMTTNETLNTKRVLTLDEFCEYTGWKKAYVYQMIYKKAIPGVFKPNGGKPLFDRQIIEEWLLSNPTK